MTGKFKWLSTSAERLQQVTGEISRGSEPKVIFYAQLTTACLMASFGLIANSTAIIIGAMLVCPLMTPILGIALALVRGDHRLLGHALKSEFTGIFLAVSMATIFGFLPLALQITPEMLACTRPNLLDLLVAVLAGFAGTYATIDVRLSPALPGVAIATSIVPPLANSGLCLALGAYHGAAGSFLLFLANFLAILLVSAATFIAAGMAPETHHLDKFQWARRFGVAGIGFLLITALLTHTLVQIVRDRYLNHAVKRVIEAEFAQIPSTSLVSTVHQLYQGKLYILATLRTPGVISSDRVKAIQETLSSELAMPAELIVRAELARDISATGSTSQVTAQNLDGFFLIAKMPPEVLKVQIAEQALREVLTHRPDLYLVDVDLRQFPRGPVIIATLQGSRALIPAEVREFERAVQTRLQDPNIRLLARCLPSADVDSQGRILYGWAHFGSQSPEEVALQERVENAVREEMKKFSNIFLTNADAISEPERWSVRVEAVGPKPISSRDLANLEKGVARRIGKPVKIYLWFRTEVMITNEGFSSVDELTRKRLQEKKGARLENGAPIQVSPSR